MKTRSSHINQIESISFHDNERENYYESSKSWKILKDVRNKPSIVQKAVCSSKVQQDLWVADQIK